MNRVGLDHTLVVEEITDEANQGKTLDVTAGQEDDGKKPELGPEGEKVPTEADFAAEDAAKAEQG